MTWFRPLRYDGVLHVARNMRAADRDELAATRYEFRPEDVARECMQIPDFAWLVGREDDPIAVVGARPQHPGVWTCFMFATDEFPRVGLSMTKHATRVIIPGLAKSGGRRAQALSIEGHDQAHEWLRFLGAVPEAHLEAFGKDGQNFIVFKLMLDEPHVPFKPVRRQPAAG